MAVHLLESGTTKVYTQDDSIPKEVLASAVRGEQDILIVARSKDYLDKIVRRQVSFVVLLRDLLKV